MPKYNINILQIVACMQQIQVLLFVMFWKKIFLNIFNLQLIESMAMDTEGQLCNSHILSIFSISPLLFPEP